MHIQLKWGWVQFVDTDNMETIIILQLIVLLITHFSLHPSTSITKFLMKRSNDYDKSVWMLIGGQCILIIISCIIWVTN
jgi:hypothetical protein